MIREQALISILEAADFDDPEDLSIRTLLIAALRESGIDFDSSWGARCGSARGQHSRAIASASG
jgi:hypothetical protein